MEELLEKIENLKNEVDKLDMVIELNDLLEKIKKDKTLMKNLKEYQENPTEELKEKIMKNKTFKKYKEKETDLNLLILEINQRLKTITKQKEGCL